MTAAKNKNKVNGDEKFERQDFDLFSAIEQIDRKNYDYYSSLSEEQRKKFVPYMMTHWISTVKGSSEVSSYYLMSTNLCANKHLFNEHVQNHPELQWYMLCASSPGIGKQFHQWIPHLSPKVSSLSEPIKKKELIDYFSKIFKNDTSDTINEISSTLTDQLNHKHKIAKIYRTMKLDEIEILSKFVSENEIAEYEEQSENY